VNEETRQPFRIRDHIGVLSGLFLGFLAFAFVVLLASKGFEPAITLLVVIVVGVALISVGSRMRA
jgi:xanthine/uracil permease